MHVPRICPPGFVCEVTGSLVADNPCPSGHFCLEGTATSATTCGHPDLSSQLFPITSHGERPSTLRKNRIAQGQQLFLGARNSGCWNNKTDDYGLQGSSEPSHFWMEKHLLPLALDSPFIPLRGRLYLQTKTYSTCSTKLFVTEVYYSLQGAFVWTTNASSCKILTTIKLLTITSIIPPLVLSCVVLFHVRKDITATRKYSCSSYQFFSVIQLIYEFSGTGVDMSNMKNFTTPQPCFESFYCPEGSADPTGAGDCPPG